MPDLTVESRVRAQADSNSAPDLSVVLVCWNNKAYLDPCLKSLYETELRHTFDVVVVDNGSTDGTQQMLAEKYPWVLIIQNTGNVGLGKASNQGIEATRGRYVLLLNNDTIVNGRSFDIMIDFLDSSRKTAAVGGKLLNPDGTIQSCYNHFSTLREEFFIATRLGEWHRPGYPAVMSAGEIQSVDWLGSACLLLRRAALEQVGLLDESYFIYGDEADLQYRLKRAGWEVHYLPQASTIHYGGRSMDRWRRRKMVYRGKLLFYRKHYGFLRTSLLRLMLGFSSALKLVVWCLAHFIPGKREQARKELNSNLEVIRLCANLA